MKPGTATLQFRRAAVQGASPAELVVLLYDTYAGDLERAIEAMRKGEIEALAGELKHALRVVEQLAAFLDTTNGGETAKSLSLFYEMARGKIIEAQVTSNPDILEEQIRLFQDVRQAWRNVRSAASGAPLSARV
jgi:flagellar protein FliS